MLVFCEQSPAISFTRLFSFGADQNDGYDPNSALIQATDGNFYGTCSVAGQPLSGALAEGTIFRLTPGGEVTPVFTFHGSDGRVPNGVIQATDGNLYGTTAHDGPSGGGTVFQVTPGGARTTLFSFANFTGTNGGQPMAPLIQGKDGNLYGTTSNGGDGFGTVFRISTTGSFTRLHSFNTVGGGVDGGVPLGKLIEDDAGNLYGTTSAFGTGGGGTVFKLAPDGTYTVLHAFSHAAGEIDTNGAEPHGGLTRGTDGNFYGTTTQGGPSDLGTVYKITPNGAFTLLHAFDGSDGITPVGELIEGIDGNFYGVTNGSGGSGTIFQITPQGVLTTIHFFDKANDGDHPAAGLTLGKDGNIYGTTFVDGPALAGTAFRLTINTVAAKLGNISTRGMVGISDEVMIGGFIISGSANKTVLVRAVGPSLSNPPFNLQGTLSDPNLSLFDGTGARIAFNDNWGDASNANSIDPSVRPTNPLESAILMSLAPGNYTAIVRGQNGATGLALVEVFDQEPTALAKLTNISTRALVQTGDTVMIGGFVGGSAGQVVVRAIGPSLANPPFNLTNVLQNPTLSLFDGNGNQFAFNDDWRSTQEADIVALHLQPSNDAESAILTTLAPGNYTAIVRGANNTTGLALVEVYSAQ